MKSRDMGKFSKEKYVSNFLCERICERMRLHRLTHTASSADTYGFINQCMRLR